jgi:flagellar motility protein MotE (MotC chaperone)
LLALGQQVTGAISTSSKELTSAERKLPEQKVIVQHSVPRVMTDLIRSQFQLLYDGLRPVLESSATSRAQLDKLRASIDDCLQNYKALQKEIEESPN